MNKQNVVEIEMQCNGCGKITKTLFSKQIAKYVKQKRNRIIIDLHWLNIGWLAESCAECRSINFTELDRRPVDVTWRD